MRAELAEVEEMQRNMAELLSQVQDGDAGDGDGSDGDDGGDGYGPAEELGADGEPSMHRADAGEVTAATDATDAMDAMDADLVETCPELTVPQAGEVGEVEVGLGEVELSEGMVFWKLLSTARFWSLWNLWSLRIRDRMGWKIRSRRKTGKIRKPVSQRL